MEELKTTNPNEKNEVKKASSNKNTKKSEKQGLSAKIADCRAEAKKIIWPNRQTIRKNTVTVIFTSQMKLVSKLCSLRLLLLSWIMKRVR